MNVHGSSIPVVGQMIITEAMKFPSPAERQTTE
jgi:hypothetical protein